MPLLTQELTQMKMCIANGYPFVFGFSVFPSFQTKEVASTGKTLALIGMTQHCHKYMFFPNSTRQPFGGRGHNCY